MSPLGWALRAFTHYADFRGRARRREFWWFVTFHFLAVITLMVGASIIGSLFGEAGMLARIAYGGALVVGFLPSFAVAVRRLHDIGRSGWSYLIAFVPIIGAIVLLVWFCQDSAGENRWGPNPKSVKVLPRASKMASAHLASPV